MHTYDPFVLLHVASLWHLPGVASHSSVSVVRLERNREKKGIKYQLKSFSVSIRESYELSNSQKPKFIWSFLFLVVLRWDLSIKVLLLSYPYCYYIKHTTCIWTALILPWKGVERKYTDDWSKKTMHTIKYNKKFSFGKIQHNIQWDKFTPLSATKGQLSYQHWKSDKNLPYTSFQVLTKTYNYTRFATFSLESRRTQASISLECKSRLASCVIFAVGTLVTSVLKKKEKRNIDL